MALETLRGVTEIGGYTAEDNSTVMNKAMTLEEWNEHEKTHPVWYDFEDNTITFKIQDGPIKEVGVNGCQVDTLIHAAIIMLKGLNAMYSCLENEMAINKLECAIKHLEHRTEDRMKRGVEGTSNA